MLKIMHWNEKWYGDVTHLIRGRGGDILMGGNWAQAGVVVEEVRGQGEESWGKGREARFEDTLSTPILLVMSDTKPGTILWESIITYFVISRSLVGWNTKAVHLFAIASKLVISGIIFILVKGQKIISLESK